MSLERFESVTNIRSECFEVEVVEFKGQPGMETHLPKGLVREDEYFVTGPVVLSLNNKTLRFRIVGQHAEGLAGGKTSVHEIKGVPAE